MKKKPLIFCVPLLVFFFAVPLSAQNAIPAERVVDNAGLLSAAQKDSLEERIASIASAYDFDLVIVTERDIGNRYSMDYADDFFDYNGYGLGGDRDGCLFLQVTNTRDYWFSTSGRGIGVLNSYAFGKLETDALRFLREDRPYEAYVSFLQNWELFLSLDAEGRSYNFFYRWNAVLTASAWLLAFAIGCLIVLAWKKGMNTALTQTQAAAYVIPGSLTFNEKKDTFLYSVVRKERRAEQTSSGGGGIHTGSSGRSHGGGGGRY